jgi:hypothetical protein
MNLAPARTLDAAWVLARRCNMLLRDGLPEGLRQLSWGRPTRMGTGPSGDPGPRLGAQP